MDSIITQVREDEQLNVFPNELRDKGEKIARISAPNCKMKFIFLLWLKHHLKKHISSVKVPFRWKLRQVIIV